MQIFTPIYLIIISQITNEVVKFVTDHQKEFIHQLNQAGGLSLVNQDHIILTSPMAQKQGLIVYPHPLKTPEFTMSLNVDLKVGLNVSQSRESKFMLGFAESTSFVPEEDEDDQMRRHMLHFGEHDWNSYNHHNKRYKVLEGKSFNLKGLAVLADFHKQRIQVDQIEFIDSSMNQCLLEVDSFNLRIEFKEGKLDMFVDDEFCKSMFQNLEQQEIFIKGSNLKQAKNLIKLTSIKFTNNNPAYTRDLDQQFNAKHVEKQSRETKFHRRFESKALDVNFSKDTQVQPKFEGGPHQLYYQLGKDKDGQEVVTQIQFADSKDKKQQCGQWDDQLKFKQFMLKDRMIAYISIYQRDVITGIEVSVYPAGNGEIKHAGLRKGEGINVTKININSYAREIYSVKMFCNDVGTTNLQFNYQVVTKGHETDKIHSIDDKLVKDFRKSSWNYVNSQAKDLYNGLNRHQLYSLIMGQNQVLDELSHINNHMVEEQMKYMTTLSEDLLRVKHQYSSLQRHHHTSLFDRKEIITYKKGEVNKILVENQERYDEFKEQLNDLIRKKHEEVEIKLRELLDLTEEKLIEMKEIQEFMNSFKDINAEYVDETDYKEFLLIGLLFVANILFITSLKKNSGTQVFND